MKIRLTCNWTDDKSLVNRFNRVYLSRLNLTDVEFTSGDEFDYLLIYNSPHDDTTNTFPKENTIGVIGEPTWNAPFYQYLKARCKYVLFHKQTNDMQVIYYPGLLPMHFDHSGNDDNCNLDYYIDTEFIKKKRCSIIASNIPCRYDNTVLYRARTDFVHKILKSDLDIDIYGKGWDYLKGTDSRIKGQIENKKYGLLDYTFSVAIENCVEDGYFTEKLTDCILTNTTPIYYGCPSIDKFFDGIYTLSNLDTIDELGAIINKPTHDQNKNKKLLATKYNLYVAISKYIKNIQG
jgi:hypothetical protein